MRAAARRKQILHHEEEQVKISEEGLTWSNSGRARGSLPGSAQSIQTGEAVDCDGNHGLSTW
jgi:hypothetical protein